MSGRPLSSVRGASPSKTTEPPISQSQLATFEQNRQRPVSSNASPSAAALPLGAKTPPVTAAGSP